MRDQAESLRKESFGGEIPRLNILPVSDHWTRSQVASVLACYFAQSGWKVKLVLEDPDLYWEVVDFASGKLDHPNLRVLNGGAEEVRAFGSSFEAAVEIVVSSVYRPGDIALAVVSSDRSELSQVGLQLKRLKRQDSVGEFGLIVNDVTKGSAGIRIYQQVLQILAETSEGSLRYLGHIPKSSMRRKNLLELEVGSNASACLDLIAKRLGEWKLEIEDPHPSAVLAACRFMDEPGLG